MTDSQPPRPNPDADGLRSWQDIENKRMADELERRLKAPQLTSEAADSTAVDDAAHEPECGWSNKVKVLTAALEETTRQWLCWKERATSMRDALKLIERTCSTRAASIARDCLRSVEEADSRAPRAPDAMREALEALIEPYKFVTEGALRAGVLMEFGPPKPERGLAIIAARAALAAPVPSPDGAGETLFVTEQDRIYAKDLLADLVQDFPENIEIAAQWFRKARVERSISSGTGAAEPTFAMLEAALGEIGAACAKYGKQPLETISDFITRLATPPVRGDREAIDAAILQFADKRVGNHRMILSRAGKPTALAKAFAAAILSLPVQSGAGEREKALRDEIFCLREVVRGVRILDHAGRFKEYDGEPWLRRVRNIGLDHDPVEFNRQPPHSSSEGGR